MSTSIIVNPAYRAPETPEESIHHSASIANKYAIELMDEMKPLINQMEINHPKESARFISLIGELISMTDTTKKRAERLIEGNSGSKKVTGSYICNLWLDGTNS
ncbi:hypothetical protein PSI23_19575 [Xenorhabdus sp. XENO-10]|uniref:Uncharacterized protein n=1 Tax=Xenorhabdus yunnanensis TaxID=3025878 RepID=A0ABT5LLT9_9GAMM|nr:hypothetical protein [Xenorhabdus yunnanensis]MDC9591421.1 hypothetical protein [Xenorhabdus yunnanensis]